MTPSRIPGGRPGVRVVETRLEGCAKSDVASELLVRARLQLDNKPSVDPRR